jgi:predicted RNase H-like nuclease
MTAVLGIDAAWTAHRPSGYALIEEEGGRWRLKAAASDLRGFAAACGGTASADEGTRLALRCAERMLRGRLPDVVAVDMPLSRWPITGRRASDLGVSRRFGAAKCATHSPSALRPGPMSEAMRVACEARGYELITAAGALPPLALAEVYPHPALLRLMNVPERLCYKVNKTATYWPGVSVETRLTNVRETLRSIIERLETQIAGVEDWTREALRAGQGFAGLKGVEDMVDAVISAWVGKAIHEKAAEPIGDAHSAIWIPFQPDLTDGSAVVA